jgi:acetyl-CoA synthetase
MLDRFVSRTEFASYEDFKANCKIIIPEGFNFAYDVVDETATSHPDKTALVWCDESGASRTFTFGDMKRLSDQAASFLQSVGIGKGDPVMLILKRHYQYWYCLLALHKLGAIAIPATHLLTAKDIAYRNNLADVKMIVASNDDRVLSSIEQAEAQSPTLALKAVVNGQREGWLDFDTEVESASADFRRPGGAAATTNDDISLLYFTSGTTGMPKMVQHDFAYPLGHIITAKFWQNVTEDGLHVTVAETGWAKAAWGKIYGQWAAGAAVFAYDFDRFDADKLLQVVSRHKVTTFCAPPTVYRFLIKQDLTQYDLSNIRYCVVAGEPLNPQVYLDFLKATGLKIREGYGQTETIVILATWPWLEPKPGSMGKPSPGYDIQILNENGEPCEIGEEGQIAICTSEGRPPGMFCGYYRDQELTDASWCNDVYYTGDIAWCDEDGYYWFVGRADDVIKSSGYRIGPFEVESALLEHPAVVECAVTGVPDPDRGAVVKATCVLTKGYTASDELAKELQEHVKHVTAPYKYPRIIEFADELPKTISGKIRRVEIREGDAG